GRLGGLLRVHAALPGEAVEDHGGGDEEPGPERAGDAEGAVPVLAFDALEPRFADEEGVVTRAVEEPEREEGQQHEAERDEAAAADRAALEGEEVGIHGGNPW